MLEEHTGQFPRNLSRKNQPAAEAQPGNAMINLALARPLGDPVMSDSELAVFVSAFESSGFACSINWYRNVDRNWHLLADADPVIEQPALMIYGARDPVAKNERITEFVPNVHEVELDCGHWIMDEMPDETTQAMLAWLEREDARGTGNGGTRP